MSLHPTDSRIGATVLAALRHWQRGALEGPTQLPGVLEYDIATNAGAVEPLSAEEVEQLCEDLFCRGAVYLPPYSLKDAKSPPEILAEIDRKAADWAAQQAPAGEDNETADQEAADTVVDVLAEVRAFITGQPLPATGPGPLFTADGVGCWTAADQAAAQTMGWEINEFGGEQLCIVADPDSDNPHFEGEGANQLAYQFVQRAAEGEPYYPLGEVQLDACTRALALAKATAPMPRFEIELVAEGINVTADSYDEAERHLKSDAREFMKANTYTLESCEPSEDEPADDAGDVRIEIADVQQQAGAGGWQGDARLSLVVEAEDRPRAIVAALRLIGVEDPEGAAKPMRAKDDRNAAMLADLARHGFTMQEMGGGTAAMVLCAPHWHILVSGYDADMPSPDWWAIGVYPGGEMAGGDSHEFMTHEQHGAYPGEGWAAALARALAYVEAGPEGPDVTANGVAAGLTGDVTTTAPAELLTFTGFCQEANGRGTVYISSVQAVDVAGAKAAIIAECAEAWGYDAEDVHCLGIAAGDVEILTWDDLGDD